MKKRFLGLGLAFGLATGALQAAPVITPWGASGDLPKPWVEQFHPKVKAHTQFELKSFEGQPVVNALAEQSYGSVVHPFEQAVEIKQLQWAWAVAQHPTNANPRLKPGDDAGAKVCVFVAIDESKLGLGTRLALGTARTVSGERLPAATLCYVWVDQGVANKGEAFPNPFTDRVRNIVLREAPAVSGLKTESVDLQADARRLFGDELPAGPVKFLGLAFGADADNTKSRAEANFANFLAK